MVRERKDRRIYIYIYIYKKFILLNGSFITAKAVFQNSFFQTSTTAAVTNFSKKEEKLSS